MERGPHTHACEVSFHPPAGVQRRGGQHPTNEATPTRTAACTAFRLVQPQNATLALFSWFNAGHDQFLFKCYQRQGDRKLKRIITIIKKMFAYWSCSTEWQTQDAFSDVKLNINGQKQKKKGGQTNAGKDKTTRHDDRQEESTNRTRDRGGPM